MRRASTVLGATGVVLLVLAGLWLAFAPGRLVKYPTDVDQTAVATGSMQVYLAPGTAVPLTRPQTVPLTIRRRLKIASWTGSRATVQETSIERAGAAAPVRLLQRYVIDRRSMKDVPSPRSYAYTPANVVDRSPAYSINLPLDTSGGPYSVWKNEAGRSYAFRRQRGEIHRDGLTLRAYAGRLADAPVEAAYIAQLAPQGIATRLTLAQLAPELKTQGVDPARLTSSLLPALSAGDRAMVRAMLAQPVPLTYRVSARTRLLVEPTTGAIVSLDRIDQTLSATADLAGFSRVMAVLSAPRYARSRIVQGTLVALRRLTPSRVKVVGLSYGQTNGSVADVAAYVKAKADAIKTVKVTVPAVAVGAGVLLLMAAVLVRRRKPAAV
jgi:hypothetical protein